MNISELLSRNARKYPKKAALLEQEGELSYRELNVLVNRMAFSFEEKGIGRGDRVMLYMPNTRWFVISFFAALRLGATAVPVSARLTSRELSYMLSHSRAKAVIAEHLLYNNCATLPGEFPKAVFIKNGPVVKGWELIENMTAEGGEEDLPCYSSEDDEAVMLYTSGTTGRPKGVVFSNKNILTTAVMMAVEMEMKPESRMLHIMPLSHSAPLHLFLAAGTYVGASHCLVPSFTPELFLDAVERWRTTHFFGAPTAYLLTAGHPDMSKKDLSSMTHWVYGGAPMGKKEVDTVQKAFRSDRFYCVYGLTEAGPNGTLLLPEEHDKKAGSIGSRAALNAEIRLVDEEGTDAEPGEPGEIILRGEGTMLRYEGEPEKTAETIRNGWLYTGDVGKMDEDGYIWVLERKKDIIISGGVNIYPKEVEEQLAAHPDISECAVIGMPNKDWGETVTACIVLKEKAESTEKEWKDFLSGKLADYKIPRQFRVISELPRNPTGKILKHRLQEVHT